ncbi:MAG: Zn-dependent hydrolase [Thermoplasmataceae archaeon]
MKTGEFEATLLQDGFFTLDPGAYFGIVPRPIWSRFFRETSSGRVKLALNVMLLQGRDFSAMIDSGIGLPESEKMRKIYEIEKTSDLVSQINGIINPDEIRFIIHSHLHFDHSGHSLDRNLGKPVFRNASLVAQDLEFRAYSRPNEFTRSSYIRNTAQMNRARKIRLNGTVRFKNDIRVIRTGGHTAGHQVIITGSGTNQIIYFGDLIPSAFHVRVPYITAIDSFPLDTVRMKKKLIEKAIREKCVCIFNHDPETPAGIISGDLQNPRVEKVSPE